MKIWTVFDDKDGVTMDGFEHQNHIIFKEIKREQHQPCVNQTNSETFDFTAINCVKAKRRILKNMTKETQVLSKKITAYQDDLNQIDDLAADEIQKIMDRNEFNILQHVSNIYEKFSEIYFMKKNSSTDQNNDPVAAINKFFYIDGRFFEDYFFLKFPILFSRNMSKAKHSEDHERYRSLYIFRTETSCFMDLHKNDIPKFDKKNITILSIYNTDTDYMPDNDNLETKSIVDAITEYIGGDEALTCSFFLASVCDSSIESGTYFVITKDYNANPNVKRMIDCIRQYFPFNYD